MTHFQLKGHCTEEIRQAKKLENTWLSLGWTRSLCVDVFVPLWVSSGCSSVLTQFKNRLLITFCSKSDSRNKKANKESRHRVNMMINRGKCKTMCICTGG